MFAKKLLPLLLAAALAAPAAHAAPNLIAIGELTGSSAGAFADLSGLSGTLENGVAANLLGGVGSGLAWAGGNTFLALPDRGPNATAWNASVDDTTSYIDRFHTVTLQLTHAPAGGLPYTLTPTLTGTTLLHSTTPLNYGTTAGMPAGDAVNTVPGKYFFTGRSDNFAGGNSLNGLNGRLDPEGIRVANDGRSVFVSDEYGPYVYQFDRASGQRLRTFDLPAHFAAANLSSSGAAEISGNTAGRVANKGMEGLAITPDGQTLVGFMQSPLLQDGGDGGRMNRIVTVDVATGATHEYAYDNRIASLSKNYNSSEILAINNHQFLVLERDGKGLGDGTAAKVKQIWAVDLAGAQDVGGLSGEAALLAKAPAKTLFLDIVAALKSFGIADSQIPAKLEALAFGQDIVEGGVTKHTLYIANDNDFLQGTAGANRFYVFSFTDADLAAKGMGPLVLQSVAAVPEPESYLMMTLGLGLLGLVVRRRRA